LKGKLLLGYVGAILMKWECSGCEGCGDVRDFSESEEDQERVDEELVWITGTGTLSHIIKRRWN
jgi:DNA replication protein DnaD